MAIAVLSALLIQEPAREFPAAAAVKGDGGEGQEGLVAAKDRQQQPEERESFREALGIVFQSNTVKLVS